MTLSALPLLAVLGTVRRHLLQWMLLAAAVAALAGNAAAAEPIDTAAPVRQSAPVIVANRIIIVLRGPIAGYSARERVANVARRIDDILESDKSPAVSTQEVEEGAQVLLGGKPAFVVSGIDIDPQGGETTRLVAREAAKRLEVAIAAYRDQHTPRYLLIQSAWAALATLIYAALLRVLLVADRWVGRRVAQAAADRAKTVHVHGVSLLDPNQIQWIARRLVSLLAWTAALFASYTWLTFVLKQFPYTHAWGEGMEGNLLALAGSVALAIVGSIPGLLVVAVILLFVRLTFRLASLFFDRIERGRITIGALDAETVVPTRRLFQIVVWAFALALAYPYLPGAETEAFKGVSVLVGLMVSIGASSLVGQAASGLILMYTRAFRVGEYVRIADTEGTVSDLGTFATRLRTGLGEEVQLPNSYVLQNTTKNFSRSVQGTGFVVNTAVTIGYATPWRQVHAMLEEAARRTPGVAADPPPRVRQTALSDFYVEYRLIAHSTIENPALRIDMMSQLHANTQDVFNENNVQIMSPHYMTDPPQAQVVPRERWFTPPAKPPEVA
jgi:small-conductance mechanosensitive channel